MIANTSSYSLCETEDVSEFNRHTFIVLMNDTRCPTCASYVVNI